MAARKNNLGDEIFDKMRHMLVSGQWQPGERLPSEKKLMEMFQASRISIREPLKRLAGLGLVETRRGAGTYVRSFNEELFTASMQPMLYAQSPTKQDILYILEVRRIEIIVAGIAAEQSSESDIEVLRALHEKMKKNCHVPELHRELDLEFHLQICRMTNNPYLLQICKLMYEALDKALTYIVSIMGPEKALYYHARLLDTISRHYVREAEAIMEEHLYSTVEAVKAIPDNSEIFNGHTSILSDKQAAEPLLFAEAEMFPAVR